MALLHKNARGFTLVELLIVITIIGILAVALLPQIVGVQASARDTSRVSTLNSLVPVMVAYNDANGRYPDQDTVSGGRCISSTGGVNSALTAYVKGGRVALDTQRNNAVIGCTNTGAFGYFPLQSTAGTQSGAYYIMANTETINKSNSYSGATASTATGQTTARSAIFTGATRPTTDTPNESVYLIVES